MKIVLQKFIAGSGYCSRRQAEDLIRDGLVVVNGEVAKLGTRVDGSEEILINGKKIKLITEKKYIALNKPKGYTCTNRKFDNEKNVFDLVDVSKKLHVVGRLDKDSHGLVLLTNDGELTQKLTHPSFEHEKEYFVQVKDALSKEQEIVKKFKKGVDIGEGDGIVSAKKVESIEKNKFRIILTEGKKRQIRRMFKVVGCEVSDLVRVRIGDVKLGGLKVGEWKFINL